jgi:hypothetical protein
LGSAHRRALLTLIHHHLHHHVVLLLLRGQLLLLLRGQLLLLLRGLLLLLLLHHIHNRLEARVDGRLLLLLLLRGEMVAEHSREVIIAPRTAARSTRARRRRTSRARTSERGHRDHPRPCGNFPLKEVRQRGEVVL